MRVESDYFYLEWRKNRGWPWPERSWGLTPMFGEDGWCHSCGVPQKPQSGQITLERMHKPVGAWIPNWQFDVICMERSLGERVADEFDVDLREVAWRGPQSGEAVQIVVPTIGQSWFDEEELRWATVARHGADGARCGTCGVWRWMPIVFQKLPALRVDLGGVDIAASPEWFGDGMQAFRQVLVRRELAELLADASPKDFGVTEQSHPQWHNP